MRPCIDQSPWGELHLRFTLTPQHLPGGLAQLHCSVLPGLISQFTVAKGRHPGQKRVAGIQNILRTTERGRGCPCSASCILCAAKGSPARRRNPPRVGRQDSVPLALERQTSPSQARLTPQKAAGERWLPRGARLAACHLPRASEGGICLHCDPFE